MTALARLLRTSPARGSNDIILATIVVLVEISTLMAMVTIVKATSADVDVEIILLFRFWFCLPGLFLLAVYQRGRKFWHVTDVQTLVIRSVVGFSGLVVMFIAISMVEITMFVALGQTCTVFVTILAPFMLGEPVGVRRWMAVVAGFIGVLIILQPGTEGWLSTGVLFALLSPLLAALMFVYLRKLGRTTPPVTTALLYNSFGTCMITAWCLSGPLELPDEPVTLLALAACGLLSSAQQFLMATAFALAPASTLAPIRYLTVPMSMAIGILLFDEIITPGFLLGSAVIVLATHYILVREKRSERPR